MVKTKTGIQQTLTVQKRDSFGTSRSRRLRRKGVVPGIVYGKSTEPLAVSVNARELGKLLHAKAGEHALVTLRLADGGAWEKPALVHAIQHHPVDSHILHVDFPTIVLTERLRVRVPVVLRGEPVGVKQDGGILEHFLRDVEVECLPTEIPAHVAFDVTALKIGDTIHVRDLVGPQNTRITSEPEGVIASVQTPRAEKPEEAAAAVTEPEVIREKKEEAEPAAEAPKDAKEAKGEKPAKPSS